MKTQLLYLATATALIAPFCSKAQTLLGKIECEQSSKISNFEITIKNTTLQTLADNAGNYTLSPVPAGTHTLVVKGCKTPTEKEFFMEEQGTLFLNVFVSASNHLLDEVTVSTTRNANEKELGIGKLAIKAMDLPQSVSVIEREVLERQQTQYMSDVLKNFNGVYIMGNTGGTQQEIAARGFALSSSNTFKNGVRFNNSILPEMSSLEKVEILKGSAAILYGNVAAGGILNLVTKKPNYKQGGEVSMRFDSYNFYKPSIDLEGVLNKTGTAAFRITSCYENAGSFRDNVNSERIYYNPSLAFKLGKKTEWILEGDYLNDKRTPDFGVGAINYQLIDIPRNTFLGTTWSKNTSVQKSVTSTLRHRFNRNWNISFVTGTQQYNNDLFSNVRPNANSSFIKTNGTWVRGIQRTQIDEQYYIAQLDLAGSFTTGFIKHKVLIGSDADRYFTATTAYNTLSKYDSINVFNTALYQQRNDIPNLNKRTLTEVPIERAGFYVQDLMDFGKIKVLAGARFSYLQTGSRVQTYSANTFSISKQIDNATTPRIGVVYQPIKQLSVFGSYANSFSPNTGVDINGKQLAPSYINQAEAGIKSSLFKQRITVNATVYQIVNSNLAQTSLENGNTNTNIKELAGEVTSQGIEVDAQSTTIKGFSFLAGYSFNETKYTKSNTYIIGSLLRYNPRHTANASAYYTLQNGKLKGIQFGSSVLYFGERYAGRSTRVTVENDLYQLIRIAPYIQLDLSAAYSYKMYSIRAKVSNLLNAMSYNVHDDNSVNPIAPRQFALTVTYRF